MLCSLRNRVLGNFPFESGKNAYFHRQCFSGRTASPSKLLLILLIASSVSHFNLCGRIKDFHDYFYPRFFLYV